MTNVKALKELYVANGGSIEDVANVMTSAKMILKLANLTGVKEIAAIPCAPSAEYWGTDVKDMQDTDIVIGNGTISGTLKYVASGSLVTTWNAHHFIALKFIDPNGADKVEVGIKNLAALDFDMDAVIAITDTTKPIRVVTTKGGVVKTQTFDISGLTLGES